MLNLKKDPLAEDSRFFGGDFYSLCQLDYDKSKGEMPNYLNRVGHVGLGYGKKILYSPFIDIPLKVLNFYPDREKGIDLENTVDLQATLEGKELTYAPLKYKSITEFVHRNGLSKDLLMANNVVQIQADSHAVGLFFGEGRVIVL